MIISKIRHNITRNFLVLSCLVFFLNAPLKGSVFLSQKQIVHASDADEGTNAEIVYSLSGVGSSNFVINGSTGVITTSHNSSLDRERNSSFYLQLVATDGGGKFSAVSLIIHLKDANDEAPRFSETVFHFNVSENGRRGATVGRITASDADEGFNKEIIYTSTGADAKFYVSRSTGEFYFVFFYVNRIRSF